MSHRRGVLDLNTCVGDRRGLFLLPGSGHVFRRGWGGGKLSVLEGPRPRCGLSSGGCWCISGRMPGCEGQQLSLVEAGRDMGALREAGRLRRGLWGIGKHDSKPTKTLFNFFFKKIFFLLHFRERGEGRERNIDLLLYLLMYSLADSCQPWCIGTTL